jgi:DNA polymerase III epsilon subunit-like protein
LTWKPTALRSNAAIASIGAVKFEDDQIVDTFYCTIDPATCKAAGLHFDKETLLWWSKQSKKLVMPCSKIISV